jgi:uncharacterized membrane protein
LDISFLLPVFQWFNRSVIAEAIRDSNWLFPAIEAVHIVALCVLLGAVFILNLRLLGVALRSTPVSRLARELAPWTLCALVIILTTGVMLFASEAMKCYESPPFQLKMLLLFAAILFHFTIYRRVTTTDGRSPLWGRLAATLSVALWLGVGFAGRFIAFY